MVAAMPTGMAFFVSCTLRKEEEAGDGNDAGDEPPISAALDDSSAGEKHRCRQQQKAHHLLEQFRPRPGAGIAGPVPAYH